MLKSAYHSTTNEIYTFEGIYFNIIIIIITIIIIIYTQVFRPLVTIFSMNIKFMLKVIWLKFFMYVSYEVTNFLGI
jgi:hypothetical protein